MSNWVSVFDKLPAKGSAGDFLVWMDNGKTQWAGIYMFDEDTWVFLRVTHWMPLPDAPQPPEDV